MKVCSQCLRSMRIYNHIELQKSSLHNTTLIRNLSTTRIYRQEIRKANTEQQIPPPIPTTTPTVTSNVTAPPPKASQLSASHDDSISTSQMQKQISQNLSSPSTVTVLSNKLAAKLLKTTKSGLDSYATYGLTEVFFKSCAAQAAYTIPEDQRMGIYTGQGPPKNARQEDIGVPDTSGKDGAKGADSWWFKTLGLEPTFSVWSQVCFLHMYILTTKLRTVDSQKIFLDYQRYLLEHFSNAAEDKMALLHGMNAKGIRNRYLKDLFVQWRGILYAYDQGLVSGDAVLAAAVWRNLWKADEDVDWQKVAMVVEFMRKSIAHLDGAEVRDIAGALKGGSPFWARVQESIQDPTQTHSQGIEEPFRDGTT